MVAMHTPNVATSICQLNLPSDRMQASEYSDGQGGGGTSSWWSPAFFQAGLAACCFGCHSSLICSFNDRVDGSGGEGMGGGSCKIGNAEGYTTDSCSR
ncbi:unnamed protein product [Linum trigynum]|uniref:Uncharacterized protein n=1 Tax=Linum trigynum TaxID=586398 RepID=A0AAV2CAD3_9ROSI